MQWQNRPSCDSYTSVLKRPTLPDLSLTYSHTYATLPNSPGPLKTFIFYLSEHRRHRNESHLKCECVRVCACVFESKIYKWSADSIFIQLILCNSLCESQKVTLASTFRKRKRERKRRDYRLFVKHSFLMLGCCHLSLTFATFIPCSNDRKCSYMLWSMSSLWKWQKHGPNGSHQRRPCYHSALPTIQRRKREHFNLKSRKCWWKGPCQSHLKTMHVALLQGRWRRI